MMFYPGAARVISISGKDATEFFIYGAQKVLEQALQNKISIAVMKARSPSCGKNKIYSGNFDRNSSTRAWGNYSSFSSLWDQRIY